MRVIAVFLLAISALGCKDSDNRAPKPSPAAETPAPPPAQPKVSTPDKPKLGEETERTIDPIEMEKTIKVIAPQLSGVTCERTRCGATLVAASEQDLVAAVSKLETDDSLRQLDAQILLSGAPEQKDGTYSVKLFVKFR
jgi:hypothetical protein